MIGATEDFQIPPYTYCPRVLSARNAALFLRATEQSFRRRGKVTPDLDVLHDELDEVVRLQTDDLHGPVEYSGCSCGWVCDSNRELGGHLDLRTLEPARVFVVTDEAGVAVACQSCRTLTPAVDVPAARSAAASHRCPWDD